MGDDKEPPNTNLHDRVLLLEQEVRHLRDRLERELVYVSSRLSELLAGYRWVVGLIGVIAVSLLTFYLTRPPA